MFGVRRLALRQPPCHKPVVELGVCNVFSQWMVQRRWSAFTLALPFVVLIFYWMDQPDRRPDPLTRVHEFVHVAQDADNGFFLLTWLRYLWAHVADGGYRDNRYEREAFALQALAARQGLPDWARD